MAQRLDNYLRMYRKRAGLSQDEVAYLLGGKNGTTSSRFERFERKPRLQTALAYEAIYGVAVKELFAGLSMKAERGVRRRALILMKQIAATGRDSHHLHRLLTKVGTEQQRKPRHEREAS